MSITYKWATGGGGVFYKIIFIECTELNFLDDNKA